MVCVNGGVALRRICCSHPAPSPTGEGRSAENGVAVDMSLLLVDKPGTTSSAARLPPPVGEGWGGVTGDTLDGGSGDISSGVFATSEAEMQTLPPPLPHGGGGRSVGNGAVVGVSLVVVGGSISVVCRRTPPPLSSTGGGRPSVEGAIVAEYPPSLAGRASVRSGGGSSAWGVLSIVNAPAQLLVSKRKRPLAWPFSV